ncbi:hypothetical protein BC834DRAFT_900892 [Gloeopeniophorella convolvens]|nr:hypothetical protein BC834DRAFT_900892 [Gloeopeniophorella convolvens]
MRITTGKGSCPHSSLAVLATPCLSARAALPAKRQSSTPTVPPQCTSVCGVLETIDSCVTVQCCTQANMNALDGCVQCIVALAPAAAVVSEGQSVLDARRNPSSSAPGATPSPPPTGLPVSIGPLSSTAPASGLAWVGRTSASSTPSVGSPDGLASSGNLNPTAGAGSGSGTGGGGLPGAAGSGAGRGAGYAGYASVVVVALVAGALALV